MSHQLHRKQSSCLVTVVRIKLFFRPFVGHPWLLLPAFGFQEFFLNALPVYSDSFYVYVESYVYFLYNVAGLYSCICVLIRMRSLWSNF
jgi:hypothetical protein